MIPTAFTGAGHTAWQTPHPVQTDSTTLGRPCSSVIAPATGHRSEQTVQKLPIQARQFIRSIHAVAIFKGRPV
ncbi:MAG: hypothetical protein AMXMBFR77_07610 [Phycisphaerales bacterium]|nr:MAG: hypothetical protein BroJett004_01360 [Planctomycetota bacterium]